MQNLQAEFEEKFNIVKNNFLKSLNEKYALLEFFKDLICKAENLNDEKLIDDFQEAYNCVHKLSGSSAMFGFNQLGNASVELELLLKEFIKNNQTSNKTTILQNLENLLNEIKKAIVLI